MVTTTLAIVLKVVKYGESQLVVDLYTLADGRISVICHASRSGKAKIQRRVFQPMSFLEVVYVVSKKAGLARLKEAAVSQPFVSIPADAAKLGQILFVAEFLGYALKGEQADKTLFDFIQTSVLWLDAAKNGYANFHLFFILRMSRFLGFFPNLEDYRPGFYFDLQGGYFVDTLPWHTDYLSLADASALVNLMRMTLTTMSRFKMSRVERNRCLALAMQYYRLQLPDFPEMKSTEVLMGLFV